MRHNNVRSAYESLTGRPLFVLTGPTGSGKSALALELADELNAEIIAMDSMTLYRGMDVGTAKPSAEEQSRVHHHLLDRLEPWESGSVAYWFVEATNAYHEIIQRGKLPLFVGGTPFYLRVLLHGLFDSPPADLAVRQRLEAVAREIGASQLHDRLQAVDPPTATRLHQNDLRRVVRALEVWELTGRPISSFQTSWQSSGFEGLSKGEQTAKTDVRCVMLDWPREQLYSRINERVDLMLNAGWLEEAEGLLQLGRPLSREASQALGYKELFAWIQHSEGHAAGDWERLVDSIKLRTRQFAKRQLTFFRGIAGLNNCPADRPKAEPKGLIRSLWRI